MPKIVDHDQRREELVSACMRVASRIGLAATTTREIAKEAGVSHGIIAHYFDGKDAILQAALQKSYEELAHRILARISDLRGVAALRAALLESLPVDSESLIGEQIELAFWSYSLGNPELADERWHSLSVWHALLRHLLLTAVEEDDVRLESSVDDVADALIALIDGLGAQAALYPEHISPQRQITVLDAALTAFGLTQTSN